MVTNRNLNKASIVGFLPPELRNISTLTTLELIGNPGLTETLSDTSKSMPDLDNLDLHDNGFYGEIPDFHRLRNMNLRGNRFSSSDDFPLPTMRRKGLARTVGLSSNDFEGLIPEDAFQNLTQLIQLNLSHNRFHGTPPTLSTVTNLKFWICRITTFPEHCPI